MGRIVESVKESLIIKKFMSGLINSDLLNSPLYIMLESVLIGKVLSIDGVGLIESMRIVYGDIIYNKRCFNLREEESRYVVEFSLGHIDIGSLRAGVFPAGGKVNYRQYTIDFSKLSKYRDYVVVNALDNKEYKKDFYPIIYIKKLDLCVHVVGNYGMGEKNKNIGYSNVSLRDSKSRVGHFFNSNFISFPSNIILKGVNNSDDFFSVVSD